MTRDEYIDALKQALSDYDALLGQIINIALPHLEALHQRCETLLHVQVEDDDLEWTAEQLDLLARQYNAIMNTQSEKPVVITTTEAMKRLREMGLVQQ